MPDEERVSEQEKMREEICERVWREQGYLANDMVIREAAKAYKAIEAGFEAGWQAAWLARGKQEGADDPVRRDRGGWQAGIDAAVTRLEEEIESWESEAKYNDITPSEKSFIEKRIGQIKTHIAQIRELKYAEHSHEENEA